MLFTYFAKHLQHATVYLLEETPIFYAAVLTVLVLLFSCVYSVRTSAYNNMYNADDNFLTYVKLIDTCIFSSHKKAYRKTAKIWLDASYSWRHLASKNCIIARNWLSSILCLVVAFLISSIYIFSKSSDIHESSIFNWSIVIIFLIFIISSFLFFICGLWCEVSRKKRILNYYLPLKEWQDLITFSDPGKAEVRDKLKTPLFGKSIKLLDCASPHRSNFCDAKDDKDDKWAKGIAKEKEEVILEEHPYIKDLAAEGWYKKGCELVGKDKNEKALTAFKKSIGFKPNNAKTWYKKASVHALMKDQDNAALENLSKAIDLKLKYKKKAKSDEDFRKLWDDEDFLKIVS